MVSLDSYPDRNNNSYYDINSPVCDGLKAHSDHWLLKPVRTLALSDRPHETGGPG
jgi:hypothetical protein